MSEYVSIVASSLPMPTCTTRPPACTALSASAVVTPKPASSMMTSSPASANSVIDAATSVARLTSSGPHRLVDLGDVHVRAAELRHARADLSETAEADDADLHARLGASRRERTDCHARMRISFDIERNALSALRSTARPDQWRPLAAQSAHPRRDPRLACESDGHLLELVAHRIRSIDGVRDTDTLLHLKLQQQQRYAWGVRCAARPKRKCRAPFARDHRCSSSTSTTGRPCPSTPARWR